MRWRWWKPAASGLSCKELVELVNDYLEGALDEASAQRFEAHLSECDGCSTYLEQIRQTITATGRLEEEALDPVLRDALLVAFRDWKRAGEA